MKGAMLNANPCPAQSEPKQRLDNRDDFTQYLAYQSRAKGVEKHANSVTYHLLARLNRGFSLARKNLI